MTNIPSQSMNINPLASSIVGAQQKSTKTTEERVSTSQNDQADRFELSKQLQAEGIAEAENETDRDADGREVWHQKQSAEHDESSEPEDEQANETAEETLEAEPQEDQEPPHLDLLA